LTDTTSFEVIATTLTPMELNLVGTSLKAGQPTAMAMAGVSGSRAVAVRNHIDDLLQVLDRKILGTVLLAMASAAKQATSEMEVVWSGPLPNDAMGRTTWAVISEVVQDAHEYIYAATYSAGHNAPAIQALRSAIDRGIQVTCMVDVHHRPEAIEILKAELFGARLLGLVKPGNEFAPMMHAKFIVVDGHSTFLTSANFSNIAVDKSLEVGLLVHNSFVAHQFKRRIEDLLDDGLLEQI
jgi:phosphatidylserine/phosphatidylglycerophosphate/cardiolipin synthase-like enzyme